MTLTRKQFDVLVAVSESEGSVTQRKIENRTGYSLGTVNRVLKELADTVQLIYNPKRWEGWTMQQFEEYPAVNFYDYVSELVK